MVLKQGDIKCSTTKVKYQDIFLPHTSCSLVKTVSYSSCCQLIDDSHYIQACNDSSILYSLSLGVLEYESTSDDSIFDSRAKVNFCNLLHLERTIVEISSVANLFSSLLCWKQIIGLSPGPAITLKGHSLMLL